MEIHLGDIPLEQSHVKPLETHLRQNKWNIKDTLDTKDETTQLPVLKSNRACNSMARHLGQDKSLNHVMAYFYWPNILADVLLGT